MAKDISADLIEQLEQLIESTNPELAHPAGGRDAKTQSEMRTDWQTYLNDFEVAMQHYRRKDKVFGAEDPVRCDACDEPIPCSTTRELAHKYNVN